jgi:hypothetical protein
MQPPTARPITDSPWFWALVFSAAGLVCVLVIMPQYEKRQRRLEMQYMAREEILRRQAEGEPAAREAGQEGEAAPPAVGELIIPIWPLASLCVAGMGLASYMLWKSRFAAARYEEPSQSGGAS